MHEHAQTYENKYIYFVVVRFYFAPFESCNLFTMLINPRACIHVICLSMHALARVVIHCAYMARNESCTYAVKQKARIHAQKAMRTYDAHPIHDGTRHQSHDHDQVGMSQEERGKQAMYNVYDAHFYASWSSKPLFSPVLQDAWLSVFRCAVNQKSLAYSHRVVCIWSKPLIVGVAWAGAVCLFAEWHHYTTTFTFFVFELRWWILTLGRQPSEAHSRFLPTSWPWNPLSSTQTAAVRETFKTMTNFLCTRLEFSAPAMHMYPKWQCPFAPPLNSTQIWDLAGLKKVQAAWRKGPGPCKNYPEKWAWGKVGRAFVSDSFAEICTRNMRTITNIFMPRWSTQEGDGSWN